MSTEANKALVRRTLQEFYNQGDLTLADEVFAANYVNHDPAQPEVRDLEGLKRYWMAICAGFPDHETTVEDLLADGEMVVKRATFRGTQRGEFNGLPASGKPLVVSTISIYRIVGGKIAECWWGYDSLGIMQQLGIMPAPEQVGV
jgi:steroid delta-isomerase-like uncharacterized protein